RTNDLTELAKVEAAANQIGRLLGIAERPQTLKEIVAQRHGRLMGEYRKELNQRLSRSNEESHRFIYAELHTLLKPTGELSKEENVERKNTGLGVIEGK